MQKGVYGLSSRFAAIVALAFMYAAFSASVPGQNIKNTDYSPDKALKSNARVNPSTLAMEMSIPLIGFPGRAGNVKGAALSYSSKVWGMENYGSVWLDEFDVRINDIRPQFAKNTAAGWSSNLGTVRLEFSTDVYRNQGSMPGEYPVDGQLYEIPNWEGEPDGDIFYVKRVQVIMPDGSTHEMRVDDTPIDCGSVNGTGCQGRDMTGTYLSVDGSRMRLEAGSSTSVLYMPDGGRYLFGAPTGNLNLASTFFDVHGNKMTFTVTGTPPVGQWTDTLGRVIADPMPRNWSGTQNQAVGTVESHFPGFESGTYDVDYVWTELEDVLLNPSDALAYIGRRECDGSGYTNVSPYLFEDGSDPNTRLCNLGGLFNPVVLSLVTLPNGQSYQFKYNVFGEITKIIYPTGAYERFVYGQHEMLRPASFPYEAANRGVTDRYVSEKGDGSDEIHWTYAVSLSGGYNVTTTAPDGTYARQYLYMDPIAPPTNPYGFGHAWAGRSYEDRAYDSNDVLRGRKLTLYDQTGPLSGGHSAATRDLRPIREIAITFEPGDSNALATMTETVYDTTGSSDAAYFSSLNAKQLKKYNYVVISASTAASASVTTAAAWFSSGDLATTSEVDYLYDSNYKTRNIVGLATETRVKDASGNVKAKSQVTYDETAYDVSSSGTMPTPASGSWIDPEDSGEFGSTIGNKRGRPTTVKNYYDISNSYYIETHSFFDQYGNVRKSRDGRGNDTETLYDDDYAFAYLTSVITPIPDSAGTYGSSTAFTTSTAYDYDTGLPTATTDANSQVTDFEYDDPLYRPTKVIAPNDAETITEYGAGTSAPTRWVKVKSQIDADHWKEGYTYFDGLGRTTRTQSVDDDGDEFALTCYDTMGRVEKASNPFRNYSTQTCSTTTGMEWTANTYDTAGRPWKVTTPDGAVVETTFGLATSGSQIGTVVTVEDQADKQRRSITNALGELKRVDEPDNSSTTGSLGSITSPNQPTLYTYDTLNNLTGVQQDGDTTTECGGASTCTQTRTFSYDALSRLKSATNPESGTFNYTYDNNGNLATKVDARNITTTYTYDKLNRVTLRAYTNEPSGSETLDVSYYYDNITNAKGKLIKVTNGTGANTSTTEYTSFDILGRVTASKQTTDDVTYGNGTTDSAMTYSYNLAGAMTEQQYPSGRKVQNTLDASGDLEMVSSRKNLASGYWAYANNFTYSAAGAVTSMQLGNGTWESTAFNSRLQPTQIALGTTNTSNQAYDKLKLNYTYGTTANNGNVLTQTITVPTVGTNTGFSAVQTYNYDSLNRLKDATEMLAPNGGSATQTWKQAFTFDRYGNRNFDEANTTTLPKTCGSSPYFTVCVPDRKKFNPAVSPGNNRIVLDQDGDTINDYGFDFSGNTTKDADSRTFIYDAENKQVEVKNSSSVTVGKYWYDGDGKRVKKEVPATGEATIFVYDAAGKLVAEYSTIVASTNDAKVAYLTNDHLGSPRVNTDKNGTVTARHDYHPFGEEIVTSQRTAGLGYAQDTVRKQFTGYERDTETSLSYAKARMYATSLGRFASVDPMALKKAFLANPQNTNRYAYTRNSPLTYTDSSGLCSVPAGLKKGQVGICIEAFIASARVGPGGIARGDARSKQGNGNDPSLSNRLDIKLVFEASKEGVRLAGDPKVTANNSVFVFGGTTGDRDKSTGQPGEYKERVLALPGSHLAKWSFKREGSGEDFGTTNVAVSGIGPNGAATLGIQLQGIPFLGGVGTALVAGAPAPIQYDLNFTITGNGAVDWTGETKGYPTYAAYAYTVNDDGTINTTELFVRPENRLEDLELPMTPIPR